MAVKPKPPLERAARALCELDGNPPGATFEGRPMWESYLPQVRAVVDAIDENHANRGRNVAYNLFIAYDLNAPGQNYNAVQNAIKGLGQWYQFQYSLFYVSTEETPADAFAIVKRAIDAGDKLAVINADSALGAIVTNWDQPPIDAINAIWSKE